MQIDPVKETRKMLEKSNKNQKQMVTDYMLVTMLCSL